MNPSVGCCAGGNVGEGKAGSEKPVVHISTGIPRHRPAAVYGNRGNGAAVAGCRSRPSCRSQPSLRHTSDSRAPPPLDEDVYAIHANRNTAMLKHAGEFGASKLAAALVGVEDLGLA